MTSKLPAVWCGYKGQLLISVLKIADDHEESQWHIPSPILLVCFGRQWRR